MMDGWEVWLAAWRSGWWHVGDLHFCMGIERVLTVPFEYEDQKDFEIRFADKRGRVMTGVCVRLSRNNMFHTVSSNEMALGRFCTNKNHYNLLDNTFNMVYYTCLL